MTQCIPYTHTKAKHRVWNVGNHKNLFINFLKDYSQTNWNTAELQTATMDFLQKNNLANGDHLWPWRVALSGLAASPSPFELADILGQTATLKRLQHALRSMQAQ